MIGWLHGPSAGGFQRLIPLEFISVDALRVAPRIDTPACTPGHSAADVSNGTQGVGRAHVLSVDHGPALAGRER
jgi:hypothetical protein